MRRRARCLALASVGLVCVLAGAAAAQSGATGVASGAASSGASAEAASRSEARATLAASAGTEGSLEDVFAVLSDRVGPSVLSIRSVLEAPAPPSPESESASGLALPPPPVVRFGSGFVVDSRGWVVTCASLVAGGGRVEAVFPDDTIARATSVYYDPGTSLAVVRFDLGARALPALSITDSPTPALGQPVFVVGPIRGTMSSPLVSPGVVSAVDLPVRMGVSGGVRAYTPVLWTTCPTMTGNQGAPLVDVEGRVLAVSVSTPREMSGAGGALASPVENARMLLEGVRAKMSRPRAWLGVYLDDVPEEVRPGGAAAVTGLFPDGPSAQAGVLAGDRLVGIVVAAEGAAKTITITSVRDLVAAVQDLEPGSEVTLEIEREGEAELVRLPVTLGGLPIEPAPPGGAQASFAAEFADLTPERRELFNVPGGAVLTRVSQDGAAWAMGLRAGDVIVRVDSEPIKSAETLELMVRSAMPGGTVTVEFRRLEEGADKLSSYLVTGRW